MNTCNVKGVLRSDKPTDNYNRTPQLLLALSTLLFLFTLTALIFQFSAAADFCFSAGEHSGAFCS